MGGCEYGVYRRRAQCFTCQTLPHSYTCRQARLRCWLQAVFLNRWDVKRGCCLCM